MSQDSWVPPQLWEGRGERKGGEQGFWLISRAVQASGESRGCPGGPDSWVLGPVGGGGLELARGACTRPLVTACASLAPASSSQSPGERPSPEAGALHGRRPLAPAPSPTRTTMRLLLLPLALALLAARDLGAQEGQEVTVEAGSNVSLPCNLTGPQLTWKWIPRYPRCAGVSGGIQEIYTVTTAGASRSLLERFKNWLGLQFEPGTQTQTSILTLQLSHMNASGVFFCASGSQNSRPISVTVTPGCPAGASIQGAPEGPVRRGASVSLSCAPCGEKGPRPAPAGGATWLIDGKQLSDPTALWTLRGNKVTLEDFSGQYEGLWSCRLPGDPPRSGSYCLELDPGAPGIQPTRPPSPGHDPSPIPPVAGASWSTALALRCSLVGLFLAASVGALCYAHRQPLAPPPGPPGTAAT
ncbi:megakaryocyte and platelet inhibitory receptor G6b isoform X1 [Pelodiscus sinensis]|uniref:megakaryocyte and platelet inhibitory receptor G6b isoform X1 n=1 Tax=Pelodiscus sinensis TaxID=13735 RepID=UPI003F6D571F